MKIFHDDPSFEIGALQMRERLWHKIKQKARMIWHNLKIVQTNYKLHLVQIGQKKHIESCKPWICFAGNWSLDTLLLFVLPKNRSFIWTMMETSAQYKTRWIILVDNRHFTDYLHRSVKKKKKKMWHVTCDMWYKTCDMWQVTHDMWHITCDMTWYDMWHMEGGKHSEKIQVPSSYG